MKKTIFDSIAKRLKIEKFNVVIRDENRPWGGFFTIAEDQVQQFANIYFDQLDVNELKISGKLSPKILIVAPKMRLSWQYHNRRAEIWKVVNGRIGVSISETDEQSDIKQLEPGQIIKLKQGERHRLIGLEDWGVVAEIWQHTDLTNFSDENDIIRVQDDFNR